MDGQIPLLKPEPLAPLPVDASRYLVALQSKDGERNALRRASDDVWERTTPLIHFVGPKSPPAKFKPETVRGWVSRIAASVATHPFYLDLTRIDPLRPVATRGGDVAALDFLYDASRGRGLRFIPVAWVGESTGGHRRIARDTALHDGNGIAMRYRLRTYVPTLGSSLGAFVETELVALEHEPSDTDLIVDLEYIDQDAELDPEGIATSVNELLSVGPWRSIVLLGTSVPTMMSCIAEGTVGSLPRREWELWSQLKSCDLDRMPAFGDYAIQNPNPPHDGGGPGMRANIRYTSGVQTLVARGQGPFYEEGKAQYRGLCERLVGRAEFAGRGFTWGDGVISDCAAGIVEPGTQNVWRGAGTSHHLREVIQQLVGDSGS